jgi:uracil-DNA glycosylase
MSKWNSILGSWDRFLTPILEDEVVQKNLDVIRGYYLNSSFITYPSPKNIFRAFRECPYDKLSVVIILQDPYHDGSATGIGLGNESNKNLSPSLKVVKDTISRTVYKGQEFNFDHSLVSWANQGILLINTALTVEAGKPGSHIEIWAPFTEKVFQKLNLINSGIIYCLWGKSAGEYAKYINQGSNYILSYTHPAYASYRGEIWDCNHFNAINVILKENNNLHINW